MTPERASEASGPRGSRIPVGATRGLHSTPRAAAAVPRRAIRDVAFRPGEREALRQVSFEGAPGARALRARMGVVFQAPSLDAKLSASENPVMGGRLFGFPMSPDHPGFAAAMRANPVAYAVSAARRALGGPLAPGALPGSAARDLAVVAAFAAAAPGLATLAARRRA